LRSSEIADIPKLHVLTDRAKHLQHEVLASLTRGFVSEVTPPDKFSYSKNQHRVNEAKLVPCLRALAAMQKASDLERAYGDLVLRPFIHATFTKGRLDSGERGSCKGLSSLFDATINYIKAACGHTLQLNEQIFRNHEVMSIDLLCNGVWATLSTALLSKFGDDLFVSGLPDLFHANYSSTANFLRQLEDCVLGDEEDHVFNDKKDKTTSSKEQSVSSHRLQLRKRIESHPSTLELWKRWNLPVYFQLRSEEVKQSVDSALASANENAYVYHSNANNQNDENQNQNNSSLSSSLFSSFKYVAIVDQDSINQNDRSLDDKRKKDILLKRPLFKEGFHAPYMKSLDENSSIKHRHFNFLIMEQMHDALSFCWTEHGVFLPPIAPKFLRLSLMILTKFHWWLESLVSEKIELQHRNTKTNDKTSTNSLINETNKSDTSSHNNNSNIKWKLSSEELVLLSCDVRRFAYWIQTCVIPTAETLISSNKAETKEKGKKQQHQQEQEDGNNMIGLKNSPIKECFMKSSTDLLSIHKTCWIEIANQLSSLCCEKLLAIKTIASSFRMTNKPAPTTCSPFLPSILAPLKDFNDVFGEKAFDDDNDDINLHVNVQDGGKDWRVLAITAISERYRTIVLEVLTTVRTMDDALRKRKKNVNKSNDTSNGQLSDAEKIGLQLYLDAIEFSTELDKLSLSVACFPALVELMTEVEPFSKFKQ